jgi:hypothetical protein
MAAPDTLTLDLDPEAIAESLQGKRITLSDGTPQPPARHTNKLREWKRRNYTGIIHEASIQPPTYPNGSPLPHAGMVKVCIRYGAGMFQGAVSVIFERMDFLTPDLRHASNGEMVTIE